MTCFKKTVGGCPNLSYTFSSEQLHLTPEQIPSISLTIEYFRDIQELTGQKSNEVRKSITYDFHQGNENKAQTFPS